ncbi:MAG: hypothetical protein UIM53_06025 [Acutalibacteraceae bacterium]|nr:hypothetical protein [Acutalibacteraceae bacterium]
MSELTKAQEKYFEDSLMRDINNNLLVCYHGRRHDIDTFDKASLEKSRDEGFLGKGFYFSTDEKYCNEYGKYKYACYLNITNPLIISDLDYSEIEDIMDYMKEHHPDYGKAGGPPRLDYLNNSERDDVLTSDDFTKETFLLGFWKDYSQQLTEYAKEKGYDGILIDTPLGGDVFELVVFEPNQIKSIDNLYPTKSDNFKDNSQEYLKENMGKMSFDEQVEVSKYVAEKQAKQNNKNKDKQKGKDGR